MKITPLDLRQQRFRTTFRGFDRAEVLAFLEEVADDYERTLAEADRLKTDIDRATAALAEHQEHERTLRNTLVTAQRLADEVRAAAEADAKRVVHEAESRADLIIQKAQARVEEVQRDIESLRAKRHDVEAALESTIGALRNTLDIVREQQRQDRDDKVLLHRPRAVEPVPAALGRPAEERHAAVG